MYWTELAALMRRTKKTEPVPAEADERRRLRSDAGVSQETASRACEVTKRTFQRWESGAHRPVGSHGLKYRQLLTVCREMMQEVAA